MKHEVVTDRTEWRITPRNNPSLIFTDFKQSAEFANANPGSTVEVRHVLEIRVESHWQVKS